MCRLPWKPTGEMMCQGHFAASRELHKRMAAEGTQRLKKGLDSRAASNMPFAAFLWVAFSQALLGKLWLPDAPPHGLNKGIPLIQHQRWSNVPYRTVSAR